MRTFEAELTMSEMGPIVNEFRELEALTPSLQLNRIFRGQWRDHK